MQLSVASTRFDCVQIYGWRCSVQPSADLRHKQCASKVGFSAEFWLHTNWSQLINFFVGSHSTACCGVLGWHLVTSECSNQTAAKLPFKCSPKAQLNAFTKWHLSLQDAPNNTFLRISSSFYCMVPGKKPAPTSNAAKDCCSICMNSSLTQPLLSQMESSTMSKVHTVDCRANSLTQGCVGPLQ